MGGILWRRYACLVLISTASLTGFPPAGDGAPATRVKVDTPLYAEMSIKSSVVGTLQAGAQVSIELSMTGKEIEWCRVSQGEPSGRAGFVPCDVLERPAISEERSAPSPSTRVGDQGSAKRPAVTVSAATIPAAGGLMYVPAGIDYGRRCPLIVALSPAGDAFAALRPWTAAADARRWLVYGSQESRNGGRDMQATAELLSARIRVLSATFPIDPARIVSAGLSGGAMQSHANVLFRPEIFAGVALNTGMMHEGFRARAAQYPRDKFAVFLASPTDFRYAAMQRDRQFLEGQGWQTRWLEFEGGHTTAPASTHERAAAWIEERFRR